VIPSRPPYPTSRGSLSLSGAAQVLVASCCKFRLAIGKSTQRPEDLMHPHILADDINLNILLIVVQLGIWKQFSRSLSILAGKRRKDRAKRLGGKRRPKSTNQAGWKNHKRCQNMTETGQECMEQTGRDCLFVYLFVHTCRARRQRRQNGRPTTHYQLLEGEQNKKPQETKISPLFVCLWLL